MAVDRIGAYHLRAVSSGGTAAYILGETGAAIVISIEIDPGGDGGRYS